MNIMFSLTVHNFVLGYFKDFFLNIMCLTLFIASRL